MARDQPGDAAPWRPCGCCERPAWCELTIYCHRIERGLGTVPTITAHAIERARERYGDGLTPECLIAIADLIADRKKALLQRKMPNGTERWLVSFQGTYIRAVYDRMRGKIVTVLPWRD